MATGELGEGDSESEMADHLRTAREVLPMRAWQSATLDGWKRLKRHCERLQDRIISRNLTKGEKSLAPVRASVVDERALWKAYREFEEQCARARESREIDSHEAYQESMSNPIADQAAMVLSLDVQTWAAQVCEIYTEKIIGCGTYAQASLLGDDSFTMIAKTNLTSSSVVEQVHEARISLSALNALRAEIPNFGYLYAALDAYREQGEVKTFLANEAPGRRERSLTLFIEYARGEKMRDYVGDRLFARSFPVILQTVLACAHANARFDFSHNDLHMRNVIVIENPTPKKKFVYKVGKREYRVRCAKVARIIDFGMSFIARDARGLAFSSRTSPNIALLGCTHHRSNLVYDFAYIFVSCIRRIREDPASFLCVLYVLATFYPWLLDAQSARPVTNPLPRAIDLSAIDMRYLGAYIVPAKDVDEKIDEIVSAAAFVHPRADIDPVEFIDFLLDTFACASVER